MALQSIEPATGEIIAKYAEQTDSEVQGALTAAVAAQKLWRETSFTLRAQSLLRAAAILRRDKEQHAVLIAREMGKPLEQGRSEIEKCAVCCEFFAAHAGEFLRDETIKTEATWSGVVFQPLGLLLAIMPWNFPFWQVFRCAAPTLMAGNAVVLKHASNVPGCALAIEKIFQDAGFPEGLFRNVLVSSQRMNGLIDHPLVRAVTLTGSVPAGKAVAARAGALLKKTVLELGGNDPYIILEDADLDAAAETCAASRMINTGQSCIAAKRFIVVEPVRERFTELFVERMRALKSGNPLDENVTVGPLARSDLRDELQAQVGRSVSSGAKLLLGGEIPRGQGFFYPPTVLTGVRTGMRACEEETFGPVAAIIPVADEIEAIRSANDTKLGLGAAVFTRDIARGRRIAATELRAGACFVNTFVKSDPRLPFGGIKESGYGRELSAFGIREFVNIKTVYVK